MNYKQPKLGTTIQSFRLQPQLDIVHIPESTYSPLPSELESSTRSQLCPTLKPLEIFLHVYQTY